MTAELEELKAERKTLENIGAEKEKLLRQKQEHRQKRDALQKLTADIAKYRTQEEAWKIAQAQYCTASEKSSRLMQEYDEKNRAFLDEQAGILAAKLEAGLPCPVCGSVHHPAPARMAEAAPTEEEVKKARKAYEKAAREAEKASAAAAKERGKVTGLLEALEKQTDALLGLQSIADAEPAARETAARLTGALSELETQIQEIQKQQARKAQLDTLLPGKEQALSEAEEALSSAKARLAASGTSIQSFTGQITGLREKLAFLGKPEANARRSALEAEKKRLQQELEAAEKNYRSCKEQLTALCASAEQLERQLLGSEAVDLPAQREEKNLLTAQKGEILKAQKAVHTRLTANASCEKHIRSKSAELSAMEEKQKWLRALSDTASGNVRGKERVMLETYIQTTYFDRIVARANVRLMKMTGGQYDLKRRKTADNMRSQSGLELDVIDHYNGTERSVKTLSGGESFKASLALALGLSDEVQMSTGIQLDTLFVDEGFGSLDPESLNQAYQTLTGLTEGNRLVGIISHVAELKERIDRQIVVTKDKSGGSRVSILT